MRILFLAQTSPFLEGGIETRSREVAQRMVRGGDEVVYLCAKLKAEEPADEFRDGLRVVRKKVLPDRLLRLFPYPHYFPLAWANFWMVFHFLRFLRREKFDSIREEIGPVPISGWLAFFPLSVRRVAIVHGLSGNFGKWLRLYGLFFGTYGYFMERCLRAGWLRYDRIMVPARWYAEQLKAHRRIADRIDWIPNGVNLSGFCRAPESGRPLRLSRLVSIGRLATNKGHRYLLEGFALAKKKFPDITLTILGEGPLESRLKLQASRLGVADSVEFLRYLPSDSISSFYHRFDLLVMPSLLEGFNLVVMEAMASGIPLLLSDIPGFSDVVADLGITRFQAGNSQDLAAQLEALLADSPRAWRLSEEGLRRVQSLDWDSAARRESDVLRGGEMQVA